MDVYSTVRALVAMVFLQLFAPAYSSYDFNITDIEVGHVGFRNAVVVDKSRHFVHTVYFDAQKQDLKYARLDGTGSWRTKTIEDGQITEFTSLAIDVDSKGVVHIAYIRYHTELVYVELRSMTSMQKRVIDSWALNSSHYRLVAIASDRQGHPYIAYSDSGNFVRLAYEDRETPNPYTWTIIDSFGHRSSFGGIDIEVVQPSASSIPKAYVVYHRYNSNKIDFLSYDLETLSSQNETVVNLGNPVPGSPHSSPNSPYEIRYEFANDLHHISYLWVDDPASGCNSCGDREVYYLHSTSTGWTTPENIGQSYFGFPTGIAYFGDLKVSSSAEPVMTFVAEGKLFHVRKTNSGWITGNHDFGFGRGLRQNDLDLDACDNLHISVADNLISVGGDAKIAHILGDLDTTNETCKPIAPEQPPRVSGFASSGTACKVVSRSYLDRPRLQCDFLAHVTASTSACVRETFRCDFSGKYNRATGRSSHGDQAYRNALSTLSGIVDTSGKVSPKQISLMRSAINRLLSVSNNQEERARRIVNSLSIDSNKNDLIYAFAKLMHIVSFEQSAPSPITSEISPGPWVSTSFGDVAWISTRNSDQKALIKLEVVAETENVRPPNGGTVLWPPAIYQFSSGSGKVNAEFFELNFNFSGLGYREGGNVKIYEVHPNFVRDVTTSVDPQRGIISGRVNKLGSYILIENPSPK